MTTSNRRHQLPPSPFPLLPLRTGVLFPGTTMTLPVGRRQSMILLESAHPEMVIGVGVQRDPRVEEPSLADLLPIGTYARVSQVHRPRPDRYQAVLEGLGRFRLQQLVSSEPYWLVAGELAEEDPGDSQEVRALADLFIDRLKELQPAMTDELRLILGSISSGENPGMLADVVASAMGLSPENEARVLLSLNVPDRLRMVHRLVAEAAAVAEIKTRIAQEVQDEFAKGQREAVLRQQLKAIQRELGEDQELDVVDALRQRLGQVGLSDEARRAAQRELRRLEGMSPGQPEHHVIRTYLEFVADLPWARRATLSEDLEAVALKLDDDHFGLDEVKRRILEHLAVRKMTRTQRGAILCLVGPPGVGKTSLGQSVADATHRPMVRVSLGGLRDEAEIRGHRRTYVGALPGRILGALRRGGAKNLLMVLDEIDKLGQGWMGSPEAALLEVLDPEQNGSFTDHYLELSFDLSEVFFICTANTVETLSPALKDRLEIIEVQGYTLDEKQSIARRHLVPRLVAQHGLAEGTLGISDAALVRIVTDYTREAGVRQLKRELTKICRAVTLDLARRPEQKSSPARVEPEDLRRFLGRERYFDEAAERTTVPGVATGLAWTPTGGEILFVESSRMPGRGQIEITGQLGEVMRESARAALSYVRSHAQELGIDPAFLEGQDLHIHAPAGAVPKDGPSAGVTIFTALASLLSGRRTRADTAMTGECTLRGRVLPVGGIKAKVLAAHRAGIARVILPSRNRPDLDDVPAEVRQGMEFVFADDMRQVLEAALEPSAAEQLPAASGQPVRAPGRAS